MLSNQSVVKQFYISDTSAHRKNWQELLQQSALTEQLTPTLLHVEELVVHTPLVQELEQHSVAEEQEAANGLHKTQDPE
jgi:hypothetical protein